MGKIDPVKLMGLSGRIGPVVAYVTKEGTQVIRAYVKPRNPKTRKQTTQRAKFALANTALSPLRRAIRRGYNQDENMYRKLVGKVCREAIMGEYPDLRVDYSKIPIAAGKLQVPADIRVRFEALTRTVVISWNPLLIEDSPFEGKENDTANIVCYNTEYPLEIETNSRDKRFSGESRFVLKENWIPAETHFWIYFRSYNERLTSNSTYLQLE